MEGILWTHDRGSLDRIGFPVFPVPTFTSIADRLADGRAQTLIVLWRFVLKMLPLVRIAAFAFGVSTVCVPMVAQTMDDGVMLPKRSVFAGVLYTHDAWDHYWEGPRERTNGNMGTVTTQATTFTGNYGLFDRVNVLAEVPYVWTRTSQGVLHGQSGIQDLTLAAKMNLFNVPLARRRVRGLALHGIGVVSGSVPLTNYTPDLQPLSLGTHSKRLSARTTLTVQSERGFYFNSSVAYTWRGNVTLDRSSYYTNGKLYFSDQVGMPNLVDYNINVGYYRHNRMLTANLMQERARGGGDIRRQDLPFVSNRTDYTRAGMLAMAPLPIRGLRDLCLQFAYTYTFDGRNVGQSSTFTPGLMYRFDRERSHGK